MVKRNFTEQEVFASSEVLFWRDNVMHVRFDGRRRATCLKLVGKMWTAVPKAQVEKEPRPVRYWKEDEIFERGDVFYNRKRYLYARFEGQRRCRFFKQTMKVTSRERGTLYGLWRSISVSDVPKDILCAARTARRNSPC